MALIVIFTVMNVCRNQKKGKKPNNVAGYEYYLNDSIFIDITCFIHHVCLYSTIVCILL